MSDMEEKNSANREDKFGPTYHKRHHYGPAMWGVFLVLGTFVTTLSYNFANWLLAPTFTLNNEMASQTNSFDVSAEGKAEIVPTKGEVTIIVEMNGTEMEKVKSDLNQIVANLKGNLLNIGLKETDMQTSGYSIYPEYNYESNKLDEIIGYRGMIEVTVSNDNLDLINQAIDIASQDGATQISNISFGLNDSDREAGEMKATQIAYEKAAKKAEELATMAGLSLGSINSFYSYCDSSANNADIGYRESMMAEYVSNEDSTQLEAGSEEITCSVSLNYKLL